MPIRKTSLSLLLIASGVMITTIVHGKEQSVIYLAADATLENTGINSRDRDRATITPQDQKRNKIDIKITTSIRKAIMDDGALSMDAHNIKVITRNGVVTLRGPVETEAESVKIQQISQLTVNVKQVENNIEIKSP